MIFDTQPTQFDLKFPFFGFPVRVTPWFWVVAVLLGYDSFGGKLEHLLLWVACVFVSILIHEFGHAFFYRMFGARAEILLIGFGGLAIADRVPAERWKRILISFAGPLAQFLLAGLVFASDLALDWRSTSVMASIAYFILLVINIVWGLFNLLPIWPLDGGKICREVCGATPLRNPDATAFTISFLLSAGLAAVGVLAYLQQLPPQLAEHLPFIPGPFMTLWMVMFAIQSYQLWQQATQTSPWDQYTDDDTPPWRR